MTVSRVYNGYGVSLGATLLGGITAQDLAVESEIQGEVSSGEVWARWMSMYSQRVNPSFTTRAIDAALDVIGTMGKDIADLSGGFSLYARKREEGGTFAADGNHRKYCMVEGLLLPQTLTVPHRGDATLTVGAVITYDDSNDPLVITDSVSLPAGLADSERFTLGDVSIGGVTIGQIQQVTINFGLTATPESADSEIWDTFASITNIAPTITISTSDLYAIRSAGIPLSGKQATHANTSIELQKRLAHSTFAESGHKTFTAAGMASATQAMAGIERGTAEIQINCEYDGSNNPIVISA